LVKRLWVAALAAGLAGCGENPADKPIDFSAVETGGGPASAAADAGGVPAVGGDRATVLASVIRLIESASINPGGSHFTMAAESLNDYFGGGRASDFAVPDGLRAFLVAQQVSADQIKLLEATRFDGLTDGRHIEDTLLLRDATRAALKGLPADADELARAVRLFDWVVRHVQLVPPGLLAAPDVRTPQNEPFQAQARPYDVLLRGLAAENGGVQWAERSWLFLAMCRQAGLDAALLVLDLPTPEGVGEPGARVLRLLACGVLADGRIHLFHGALGRPIAGPGGVGVATLEQAATDPSVLAALEIPGEPPFAVTHAELGRGRLIALIEATTGSMAQRMRLLQQQLAGDQRMVVYSDPSEVAAAFRAAGGSWLADARLWDLPREVEVRLFRDNAFNRASGYAVRLFNARWPLLKARLAQLKGNLGEAIELYVLFRFAEGLTETDGKTPVDRETQDALDAHATQFLALAQLDRGATEEARDLFKQTLRRLPEPGPGRPYYAAFRWGAQANLGRMLLESGEPALATRYLTLGDPTPQGIDNQLRAREAIWRAPFVPETELEHPPAPATYYPAGPMLRPVPAAAARRGS
jgi:hypothetical protein